MAILNRRLSAELDGAKSRGLTITVIRRRMADLGHPISAQAISNWKAGHYPSVPKAIAFADILGTTVNYLFSSEDGGEGGGEQDGFGGPDHGLR